MIIKLTASIYRNAPTTGALTSDDKTIYGDGQTDIEAIAHALATNRVAPYKAVSTVVHVEASKVVGKNLQVLCKLSDETIAPIWIDIDTNVAQSLLEAQN